MQGKNLTLIFILLLSSISISIAQSFNPEKIESDLLEKLQENPKEKQSVLLLLADQVDVLGMKQKMKREKVSLHERRVRIVQALEAKAASTQAPLLAQLNKMEGIENSSIVPFWAANFIQVDADAAAIAKISQWEALESIELILEPQLLGGEAEGEWAPPVPNGIEPGLRAVNAPRMWRLGYTGYGTTALIIDSGQDLEHPALKTNFWGQNVPINQAWSGSRAPEDCDFHGTSVAGVVLGIDRVTNDTTGVAPNAKWMGGPFNPSNASCRLEQPVRDGFSSLQWALNPDGNSSTTGDIPDVINNSWGGGTACNSGARNLLNSLEAAGVAVLWSAGNAGPEPTTTTAPANLATSLVNAFAVGSVNAANGNRIAVSSSRGPSNCSGESSLLIKPEIVAPGERIRTTSDEEGYTLTDGTSFASPHAAGAVLLLKEAFPEIDGEDLLMALYRSARDLGAEGEDNTYGNGMLDVFAAYNFLIDQGATPTPPMSAENDVILVDVDTDKEVFCRGSVNVNVTFENAGVSDLTSLGINYFLTGGGTNQVDQIDWTGRLSSDETTTFTLSDIEDLPAGEYEVIIEIISPNGRNDARDLNNRVRHNFEVIDLPPVDASIAAAYENNVCRDAEVILESNSTLADNQTVQWYDAGVGGNLVAVGSKVLSTPLAESTTFYADIITENKVGKTGIEEGENTSFALDRGGLTFTALQPFTLKTVKVFAEQRGGRIIKVIDSDDNQIAQKVVSIDVGESVIELDFDIPRGEDYRLVLSTGRPLLHSRNRLDYPYTIENTVIIRSAAEPTTTVRYLYFYDWTIEASHPCGRTALAVDVTSSSSAAPVFFTASADTVVLSQGGTLDFTNETNGVSNLQWDFGDGNTSTASNPTHTYTEEGNYTVILTANTNNGCLNSASKNIVVVDSLATSISSVAADFGISVYPNPTNALLTIERDASYQMQLQLFDLLGRRIQTFENTRDRKIELNLSSFAAGIYYLWIEVEGATVVEKIVKE
ncbi:MAG: S8 family serine peptidase [Bacteroidota bacterium]